jgi:hypothetical protein
MRGWINQRAWECVGGEGGDHTEIRRHERVWGRFAQILHSRSRALGFGEEAGEGRRTKWYTIWETLLYKTALSESRVKGVLLM